MIKRCCQWLSVVLLLSFVSQAVGGQPASNAAPDPRNVKNGFVIPDEGYCDQPYVVVTRSGKWLCVLTTGAGKEGDVGQHVVSTVSTDKGRNWSKPIDIEPADGPEASWVVPLATPGGRVYAFYDYNGDRVNMLRGKKARADMLGWYCYRYTDDEGASWSKDRYRLPMRLTACDRANDWQGKVQIFWGISKPITVGDSGMFAFTKLGKHLLDNGEGWFYRSDNILTEADPAKLHWELLPEGDHGVRNDRFGSVQEEHNIVGLGGDDLYCIYRTTTGNPCESYSRDGGKSWTTPDVATYTPGGRPIKHCRACPKLWWTANGKYLLWFHNHGGRDFKGRNPAWICGGEAREGHVYWSQPEILLYDDDPDVRMSYPDLIEQDGHYWVTETQKTIARAHSIDTTLLEGLWRQVDPGAPPRAVANSDVALALNADQLRAGQVPMPQLSKLSPGQGFSVEMRVRLGDAPQTGTMLDATDSPTRGLRIAIESEGQLGIELGDGQVQARWSSDKGLLTAGREHHVVVTVDGGPKTITFIVDGHVCDGGAQRDQGWGRFDPAITDVNAKGPLTLSRVGDMELTGLQIYSRPLRNSEAIDNFRLSRD